MATHIKTGPIKIIVGIVVAVGAIVYFHHGAATWSLGNVQSKQAQRVGDLPKLRNTSAELVNVKPLPYPSAEPSDQVASLKPYIPTAGWEWNAQDAFILAMGGPKPTKGSLMEANNVNVSWTRIDSNDDMGKALLKCGTKIKKGLDCDGTTEVAGVWVMGDGAANWKSRYDAQLIKENGPDYFLEIIAPIGMSYHEDAFIGPADWLKNPKHALGGISVAVKGDGDWNLILHWAGDNQLKVNENSKVYDPDALNIIDAPDNDYIKAVTEVYNQQKCYKLPIVKDGKLTGQNTTGDANDTTGPTGCVTGVATWTPGDEQAINGAGGVKIVDSHTYAGQMPCVLLGIHHFFHRNDVKGATVAMLAATYQAGDQIKAFPEALAYASKIAVTMYNGDQTTDYWQKYFTGFTKNGVFLGGSQVWGIEDALAYIGQVSGQANILQATYTKFATVLMQQLGDREPFKSHPPAPWGRNVFDPSFVTGAAQLLQDNAVQNATVKQVDYSAQAESGNVVSKSVYHINFATGSATPDQAGQALLAQLKNDLATSQLALRIDGYTDNTGSAAINTNLSLSRAQAIKQALQSGDAGTFPNTRFASVDGHGPADPVCSSSAPSCLAQNRRVVITQVGQ